MGAGQSEHRLHPATRLDSSAAARPAAACCSAERREAPSGWAAAVHTRRDWRRGAGRAEAVTAVNACKGRGGGAVSNTAGGGSSDRGRAGGGPWLRATGPAQRYLVGDAGCNHDGPVDWRRCKLRGATNTEKCQKGRCRRLVGACPLNLVTTCGDPVMSEAAMGLAEHIAVRAGPAPLARSAIPSARPNEAADTLPAPQSIALHLPDIP